jgi:iron complex outermembrane receptor protein
MARLPPFGPGLLALALGLASPVRATPDPPAAPPDVPNEPPRGAPCVEAPTRDAEGAIPPTDRGDGRGGTVEEIVVRGVRLPQAKAGLAAGASVTVVDAGRYAGEAKGVAELVATSPGVAVTDHGFGGYAALSIRGSSAEQVKVLLDGVPINPSMGGGVDLSSIPPQWISRVEIVRGTEGVHHGSGALGGVVNVVTVAPRAGTWSTSAAGGSSGTWQADVRGAAGGDAWAVLAAAAASTTTGRFSYLFDDHVASTPDMLRDRVHNASATAGALVKAFALAGGGRLDVAAQLSGGRRDLPGSPYHPTPEDWQEDARGLASARFRRPGPGRLFLFASASTRVDRVDARLEDLGGVVARQRGVDTTAAAGAEWTGTAASVAAELEAGMERLWADGMRDRGRTTLAATFSGEALALDGRARLGPGVRIERRGDLAGVSAKLGGALGPWGPLSLRASGGRTYRAPSFAELYLQQGFVAPNPDLRPEVGIGGDAAVVADGRFGTATVGAFATLYRDLVVYESVSFRRLAPQNAAKSAVRGVEAELATAPSRRLAGLSAALAYTLTDSATLRGREGVLGSELPRKPRHRLFARVAVDAAAAGAHVEAQWISRQWLDTANVVAIPAALTFGAGASVQLWRAAGLRLHVEARNLLDDRTLGDTYGYPLPGRSVFVTLRATGSNEERQ